MGKGSKMIVALDVGSRYIRVVAAQSSGVLVAGQTASRGVRRGIVESVDTVSYAIQAALEDAGLRGRCWGAEVYANLGGKHLASVSHRGEVYVSRSDGLVTGRDLARAIAASTVIELPEDAQVIHVTPWAFRVDGCVCRRDPVGMHGATVGAESLIVTASAIAARELSKAVQMAGMEIDGFVANSIAAGQAALTAEEKEQGVVLVDIGGGATDVVAYWDGAPFHTSSLPVGGNQIANDVAIALNTSFAVAERLYREAASGSSDGIGPREELTVECFGLAGTRTLSRAYLNEVVQARLGEILRMACFRARQAAPKLPIAAGLVLTGGVARLPGIELLARQVLELPARVGKPLAVEGAPEELADPSFATAMGILQMALDPAAPIRRAQPNGAHSPFRLLPQRLGLRV